MPRIRSSFALLAGLVLGSALLARASGGQPGNESPAASIPIVGISGVGSKAKETGWVRVTSADGLRALWNEHAGDESDAPAPPSVDFDRCVVLAYFDPDALNASGVRVESIEPYEHGLIVRYDVVQYQTASFGAEKLPAPSRNAPYGFFVIDRSNSRLVFHEDTQPLLNHPPQWTIRWVLEPAGRPLERSQPSMGRWCPTGERQQD